MKIIFIEINRNKKILGYAKEGLINLYMSRVVVLELRKQFQDEIEENNRGISKMTKVYRRLDIDILLAPVDVNKELLKFDRFFSDLEKIECFEVLNIKNEHMPDIVDRAIYRKKPFTKEKSELKDALIWKSYSEFVEIMQLQSCILLTNNTSDFCDKQDPSRVHPELLKDTNRFEVVNKSFEFVKKYGSSLESPAHKLKLFAQETVIDEKYVDGVMLEFFSEEIEDKVRATCEKLIPSDVLGDDFWVDGYVSVGDVSVFESSDVEFEILSDFILVSGKIFVSCDAEVFEYNVSRDPGDDHYNSVAELDITFEVYFNFNLSIDEEVSDFEITDIVQK